ncbi:hypothetical protein B0T13DRAFT_451314 [Neurospora crassa]|nr:hypothetical protein B0T13DRAFT_451314 [Neurospora crassa]
MNTLSSPYLHARTDPRMAPRKPGKARGTGCRPSHGAEWTNGKRWKDVRRVCVPASPQCIKVSRMWWSRCRSAGNSEVLEEDSRFESAWSSGKLVAPMRCRDDDAKVWESMRQTFLIRRAGTKR